MGMVAGMRARQRGPSYLLLGELHLHKASRIRLTQVHNVCPIEILSQLLLRSPYRSSAFFLAHAHAHEKPTGAIPLACVPVCTRTCTR